MDISRLTTPNTDTPTIKEIQGPFFIPSYQRGYKWRKHDVEYLITDLYEYNESSKPYYMQPLVVAEKEGHWIVVDGQQRLTTFYLLWRYMYENGIVNEHPLFELLYEKRSSSTEYLQKDSQQRADITETPDIKNFKAAEEVAEMKKELLMSENFQHNFFEMAKFIWYKLDDANEGPKTFERLNGKRIPLTDIELCKVLLLSKRYTPESLRSERGMAWQMMEYKLQDNCFFDFISTEHDTYHDRSRMAVFLSALRKKDKSKSDDYENPIYRDFKTRLENHDNVWKSITRTFHTIEKWYNNPLYYNIIGFLVHSKIASLSSILDDASSNDFDKALYERLKNWIGNPDDIRNLTYKDSRTYSTLLLFNILCDLYKKKDKCEKLSDFGFIHKFPFHEYYNDFYDVEHVHATHSESLRSGLEWKEWTNTILSYIRKLPVDQREEILKSISQINDQAYSIMLKIEKLSFSQDIGESNKDYRERQNNSIANQYGGKDGFKEVFDAVTNAIEQNADNEEDFKQNSIGNLALLNRGINRGQEYAAAPFAVKSSIIKEKIAKGKFVPTGTKMMFDKSFRTLPSEMYHWRKDKYSDGKPSDRKVFIEYIIKTISKCLPYGEENN